MSANKCCELFELARTSLRKPLAFASLAHEAFLLSLAVHSFLFLGLQGEGTDEGTFKFVWITVASWMGGWMGYAKNLCVRHSFAVCWDDDGYVKIASHILDLCFCLWWVFLFISTLKVLSLLMLLPTFFVDSGE